MNNGLLNEKEIVNELFGKRFCQLSPFWQDTVKKIFPDVRDEQIIIARYIPNFVGCKTDFELQVGSECVNISVKSGKWPSIHQERINYFLDFLKEESISQETINFIAFYLYADGTVDGSGDEKISTEEIKLLYMDRIQKANVELNNIDFIKKMLYRALIKGRKETRKEIDYLYYGDFVSGYLISKEQIMNSIPYKNTSNYKCLHCGPLIFINKDKQLNRMRNPEDYHYLQLKRPTLFYDLKKIRTFKAKEK
jgi:hypothetical protein